MHASYPDDNRKIVVSVDSLPVLDRYMMRLDDMISEYRLQDSVFTLPEPDPYFYRLLVPGTYYNNSIHSVLALTDTLGQDDKAIRIRAINHSLADLYVSHPWLITQTQEELKEQGVLRKDINDKIKNNDKLAGKVATIDLGTAVDEDLVVVTRRPNFWKYNGSTSMNFAQNYSTKNWGNSNVYSGLGRFALTVSYNNQRKFNFTNVFDAQLGFQTDKNDTVRVFKPNTNTMRNTFNAGYKINKYWNYSIQVHMSTQIVPVYQSNSSKVTQDVLSPLNVTIAPGLTTSFAWGKKKKFTGNMSVAPMAYNIVYVQRPSLVTRYGVRPGHHSKHTFGPNVTVSYNWPVCKNINWSSRIYWFSNLHLTRIEWENNFRFTISKLISATMQVYPRFDDTVGKNTEDSHLQFRENLGLGLSYSF